jgi:raffinose/stachyose/melibiose transport system permease protein
MTKGRPAWARGYAIFLLPGMILFTVIILVPFLANIGISFTKWTGVGAPVWIGLANYARAIRDSVFWASFTNNLLMIFAVTVVPTIVGLLLAVFLFDNMAKSFGNGVVNFLRGGYYLPQVLPVAIAGVVWGWILDPNYGTLNWILTHAGLSNAVHYWLGDPATALPTVMVIMIWFQIGYPLVIFLAALQRIDPQILEAASLDGASWFQRFRIIVALIRPEIGVVVLTTTIYALKLFAQVYVLTRGGPGTATIVPSYFAYQNFFEKANVGYGSTIATIMTFIILLLSVVFIRVQSKQERIGEY